MEYLKNETIDFQDYSNTKPERLTFLWYGSTISIYDVSAGRPSKSESWPVVSNSLRPHGLYSPWNSPGQNTGVGSLSLLQGIFPTQGLNPDFLHCRWILYHLSHKGSPRILEWVASSFYRGSCWHRNQTGVSCIVGRFFTSWATGQYTDSNILSEPPERTSNILATPVHCHQQAEFPQTPSDRKVLLWKV